MNWYKIAKLSPSEALFGFMAWLTTRDKKSGPFSAKNNSSEAAKLVDEFCKTNNLEEPKGRWDKELKHPKDKK